MAPFQPIAVIGMACRVPGAANLDSFWRLQCEGVDPITEVPVGRWDISRFYDPYLSEPAKMSTRWGGFLPDLEMFDAAFFGASASEARVMDPQQRLLLELGWHAVEDAALHPDSLRNEAVGVFAGISGSEFAHFALSGGRNMNAYAAMGAAPSLAVNRLSRCFGWTGPSIGIDSGCSSSLVAVHLACQSLHSGETVLALACGVNAVLAPETAIALSHAWMMASDGRCRSFDADADGYVRSEGCGVAVLKRLSDAVRDGDPIRAVIVGSAVGHGGTDATASAGQQAVACAALASAALDPDEIGYIEGHGVGTALADREELVAMSNLIARHHSNLPCYIGSVKSHIGHLETAAGIISLIRTVQILEHGLIPPVLHLKKLNSAIDWTNNGLAVATEALPWRTGEGARVAGINSFGLGGTNAHVLITQAPPSPAAPLPSERPTVLLLSARTPQALREMAGSYAEFLRKRPAINLADVCHTALVGRARLDHCATFAAADPNELISALDKFCKFGEADYCAEPTAVSGRRISLPNYPFERRRYWPGSESEGQKPVLRRIYSPGLSDTVFETTLDATLPLIGGHRIYGVPVVSGPVIAELIWDAFVAGADRFDLTEIEFLQPLFLADSSMPATLQLVIARQGDERQCRVYSVDAQDPSRWTQHAVSGCAKRMESPAVVVKDAARARLPDADAFYASCASVGLALSGSVRVLAGIQQSGEQCFGALRPVDSERLNAGHLIRTYLQAGIELLAASVQMPEQVWLPVGTQRIRLLGDSPAVWGHATVEQAAVGQLLGHASFWKGDGILVAEIAGLQLRAAPRHLLDQSIRKTDGFFAPSENSIRALHDASSETRREMLISFLREQIAALLKLPSVRDLPTNVGLFDIGLDSLALVELRNRLQLFLGCNRKVPITTLFNYPTLENLSDQIAREFFGDAEDVDTATDTLVAEVQKLSEERVEQSLREFYSSLADRS